ncbi:phosphotransferase family protein [Acidimicrobium ferrooxidans]|uniref:Phosphotransferase family protein n=1 Tax=Acidimicrobium ferrooxidans TaxID=53635 RepID=A0ABS3AQA3_9ACTN|nr:phosphotransferase family protein [Acidimicrobium ferrooxidans]
MTGSAEEFVAELPCWAGPIELEPLLGGTTNTNFVVRDGTDAMVVRLGHDIAAHGIVRTHELAACNAAHRAGLGPEIVHHQPGALVMRYVEARTLQPSDLAEPAMIARLGRVLGTCHREVAKHLRGPTLMFWVFHVCRGYLAEASAQTCRLSGSLSDLAARNNDLEKRLGPIEPAFCHNDLLAANFMDDGNRLWLLDWEYAGWNSPWFDLANLSSNNEFSQSDDETLIGAYFGREPTRDDLATLLVMKCASLLRELLWNLTQERVSTLDLDYEADTNRYLHWFNTAYEQLSAP